MKILYVENDEVFAEQVTRLLLFRHEVIIVPSLAEARRALEAGGYDLLIIDYVLDDGKGTELVTEVRATMPKLPMIGASSHEDGNKALLKAGVNAVCIKKEFNRIEEIIRRIIS
ncbi:MAG: putative two-component response regulator [Pedosphaera sp.]|nr:putative two-component response regulator [Pedosphaera sp.]